MLAFTLHASKIAFILVGLIAYERPRERFSNNFAFSFTISDLLKKNNTPWI
jgi:hypothetical protein